MEVGQNEGKLAMRRMGEVYRALLSKVTHLVANTHRLLNQILVTIACDFLVEFVKLGRDQDESEVFMGRSNLELLQHLTEKHHEIGRNMQIVDDYQVLFP